MPEKIEDALDWLRSRNVTPTRQRRVLAELLVGDGKPRHVTAESLHIMTKESGEQISLATVYNTLRTFVASGLIKQIVTDGAKTYYDTRTEDHPHYYWEETGALTDAPMDAVAVKLESELPRGTRLVGVDAIIRLATDS